MSTTFKNVFILGATSGLGAALARRYYQDGKKVMIAGRRQELLQAMQKEMPNLETIQVRVISNLAKTVEHAYSPQIDVEDLKGLPEKLKEVTTRLPDLDQIILMAGRGSSVDFKTAPPSTDAEMASEIVVNVTFPMVASRILVQHLLPQNKPAQIVLVSSGLAFVPFYIFPTYCSTKAALHSFACCLRGQLASTSIAVTELVPPFVDTDFNTNFGEKVAEATGGKIVPMTLDDFTNQAYAGLEGRSEGKPKNEIAIGSAAVRSKAWWDAIGPIFDQIGLSAQRA